jgi:MSHA biogenesis protein MshE
MTLWIVAKGSDNIPRSPGFSPRRLRSIQQLMLHARKPAWLPLGALLVREGLISNEQLELALIDQQGTGLRLGELLVQWGWVDSAAISRALAEQYELDYLDLDAATIDPEAVSRLPAREARRRNAIPIRFLDDGRILVGVADPTDVGACDELRSLLGGAVTLVVVDQVELHRTLAREYS